ncbi:40S ribosomal protein S19b [Drosophila pseudoobscura]|uniref:40S ribosomal protein S19b n=1 Tax=Drosophila pseudoobscura pseudoobscura TaxID=46245 RepID=A0A6I8UPE3_DROPS|nr:40S ribosomal protein S19b [Drosophila pseudoobscura]XP_015037375.1 40S ribosomal protein S19b [Drosophila pseudoobscura]
MPGVTVKDVDQHVLTKVLSAFLKKSGKITVPEKADYIKTGKFKETAPTEQDWFYTRCASIMRHLYFRSPAGVAAFTKVYSGRKRKGVQPSKYCRSSDGCIRMAFHALETARMIEKHPEGGRKLTPAGQRDMDRLANQIVVKQRKVETKPVICIGDDFLGSTDI